MKKISLIIFLLLITISTTVLASTNVNMEIVEDNVCTIDLNEYCSFEKKIVESNLDNHQVTLQLQVTNNAKTVIPTGELLLVIDSSSSMNEIVKDTLTRKDLVLNSANKLVETLLKLNPSSLKIGVVTFSASTEKNDNGFLITGTEADAQKVCDFTNDLSVLKEKISNIEGTGQYTNLDSGLQLAKSLFTSDNNNKYAVILTDGLPNLAVGNNDLVTYDGLKDIIEKTKNTLQSFKDIEFITMLTGIDNEEATFRTDGTNSYTYGQVITAVFGTESDSTIGKFYKIDDSKIEETITDKIYNDLLPIETCLEDITILDYFPQYITDNFDITIKSDESSNDTVSVLIDDTNKQYISWKIDKLTQGESKQLQYTISLKDKFDETIIDKILDTNENVNIIYKDFDKSKKEKNSNITPKIKLVAVKDETIVAEPIPKAGSPVIIYLLESIVIFSIFFGYKVKKFKF